MCHYGLQLFSDLELTLLTEFLSIKTDFFFLKHLEFEGWRLVKKTNVNNVSRTQKSHLAMCDNKKWEQLQIILQRNHNAQIKQAEQRNSDNAGESFGMG